MNGINFTNEQIEFIKNASDHVEMLCGGRGQGKTHKLINEMQDKINNLQSKIDEAIEYIEKYLEEHVIEDQPDEQSIFYDEKGRYIPNAKEQLLDILKEDK